MTDAQTDTETHSLFSLDDMGANQPSALEQAELDRLTDELIAAFKTIFDPEIPVDIYELGLIYRVDVSDDRDVVVDEPVGHLGRLGRQLADFHSDEGSAAEFGHGVLLPRPRFQFFLRLLPRGDVADRQRHVPR